MQSIVLPGVIHCPSVTPGVSLVRSTTDKPGSSRCFSQSQFRQLALRSSILGGDLPQVRRHHSLTPPAVSGRVVMQSAASTATKPISVLFVCLGNICRSPSAEAVFRTAVEKRGLASKFNIDSAGMIDYHQGNPADARMRDHASRRGIRITSISRPVVPQDFVDFDVILAMDQENQGDLLKAFQRWSKQHSLPEEGLSKVKMMCSFCRVYKDKEVPDPYYGGPAGFEKVLDLLDDACEGLLDSLLEKKA